MYYLTNTGLFDAQHQNVVIVVTKALIFWSDYDDLEPKYEKGKQWERDAKEKTRIKKLVVE